MSNLTPLRRKLAKNLIAKRAKVKRVPFFLRRDLRVPSSKILRPAKFSAVSKRIATVFLAATMGLVPVKKLGADGSLEPALNPALRAGVNSGQITFFDYISPNNQNESFKHTRLSLKPFDSKYGPVFIMEQVTPEKGHAPGMRFGVAEKITISPDSVLKLGILSPSLDSKFRDEFSKARIGLILTKGNVSLEAQRIGDVGNQGAQRFSAGYSLPSGAHPNFTYSSRGFLFPQDSVSLRLDNLEKAVHIPLGKVSAGMGLNLPLRGANSEVEVNLFRSTKFGGVGVDAYGLGGSRQRYDFYFVVNLPPYKRK